MKDVGLKAGATSAEIGRAGRTQEKIRRVNFA